MRSSVRYGRVDSMETMLAFLEKIGNYLMLVRLTDILDVAIIAFLVYKLLDLVKSTRAENILKGVVMFLLALWLAEIFHLNGIAYILGNMVQVGILALIILFQPEIRQILEKLGSKNIRLLRAFTPAQQQSEVEKAIDQTVIACKEMSQSKTGVLIVFERHILLDDMVDTAGSLCGAAKALVELGGATEVFACASHGVLSGPALQRLEESVIKEVLFLDTIPGKPGVKSDKIKYLSAAPMLADAISFIYHEDSVSRLFV